MKVSQIDAQCFVHTTLTSQKLFIRMTYLGLCSTSTVSFSIQTETPATKTTIVLVGLIIYKHTFNLGRSADVKHEQNFSAFAEKRRQQSDRKSGTVKSFFMKSTKKGKAEDHPSQSTQGIMILYWFSIHKIFAEVIQCCATCICTWLYIAFSISFLTVAHINECY